MSTPEVLEEAARNGEFDPKDWPAVLETIVARLDHIFHNEFPRPSTIPLEPQHIIPSSTNLRQDQPSSQESQTADKENAPPSTPPSRPPVPPFSTQGTNATPTSSPALVGDTASHTFPPELVSLHHSIRTSLTRNFPKDPPHTIQRLAELIVNPKAHYRFLPSYLRALDRVISVSSPTTTFPLPQAILPSNHNLVNGDTPASTTTSNSNFGSDESLGGALLTPIPWLRPERSQEEGPARLSSNSSSQNELVSESTEMVDGPNGAGRIETVTVSNGGLTPSPTSQSPTPTVPSNAPPNNGASVNTESLRETGAITQGELLRQEQEAGVVPVSQTHTASHSHAHPQPQNILPSNAPSQSASSGTSADPSSVSGVEEDIANSTEEQPSEPEEQRDERPHARGPENIGMEDMGPQQERTTRALDITAAVGRQPTSPGRASISPEVPKKDDESKDQDMTDADAADTKDAGEEKAGNESSEKEDVVLTDVDGNTDEKLDSMEVRGEGKGAESVDTSGQ